LWNKLTGHIDDLNTDIYGPLSKHLVEFANAEIAKRGANAKYTVPEATRNSLTWLGDSVSKLGFNVDITSSCYELLSLSSLDQWAKNTGENKDDLLEADIPPDISETAKAKWRLKKSIDGTLNQFRKRTVRTSETLFALLKQSEYSPVFRQSALQDSSSELFTTNIQILIELAETRDDFVLPMLNERLLEIFGTEDPIQVQISDYHSTIDQTLINYRNSQTRAFTPKIITAEGKSTVPTSRKDRRNRKA
jgi:hypothetical protein